MNADQQQIYNFNKRASEFAARFVANSDKELQIIQEQIECAVNDNNYEHFAQNLKMSGHLKVAMYDAQALKDSADNIVRILEVEQLNEPVKS